MKLWLLLLILSIQCIHASALEKEAILKLDAKFHTDKIKALDITNDGRQLITGSADKSIRVWDIASGKEVRKILGQIADGSEGRVLDAALNNDNSLLAVAVFMQYGEVSHAIRIYDFQSGKLVHMLKGHTNSVYSIDFSKDDKYLVSGSFDKSLRVWNMKDFTLQKTIKYHTNAIYDVSILKEGSGYKIISASDDKKVAMHDLFSGRLLNSYTHTHPVDFLAVSHKHIASSGFDDNAVLIFDHDLNLLHTLKNTHTQPLTYSPNGRYLATTSGGTVDVYDTKNNYSQVTKHDVGGSEIIFRDNDNILIGGVSTLKYYNLPEKKITKTLSGIGRSFWDAKLNGDLLTMGSSRYKRTLNIETGEIKTITSADFSNLPLEYAGYSLNAAMGGNYNYSNGKLVIKKNEQEVASIELSASSGFKHKVFGFYGSYILSGKQGGGIAVYDLDGKKVADLIGHSGDIRSLSVDDERLVSTSADQMVKVWNLSGLGEEENMKIEPMLSVFLSTDDEWVVWSEQGYYSTSIGGDKYVGYHINQGDAKEARFVGSESYFDSLFRPDLISLIMKTGSEQKAIVFANRTKKVKTVDIASSLPPKLYLLSQNQLNTKANSATVEFKIESETPIQNTIVMLNGRKIDTRGLARKKDNSGSQKITIDLEDGQNNIEIRSKNDFALSDSLAVEIFKEVPVKSLFKPTLYVLSVGVSSYQNKSYNLASADKDASAIANMFRQQNGKIYKDVVVKTLINEEAVSGNILDGLDWIDREATSKDIVVVFIAGHGVNDEKGNYYFLSHDGDVDRLRRTGVKWLEIEDTISNLPSKVILLADTCHSGNIMGQRRDITSAIKSITNSGSGSVIMTAATGNGYSYEQKDWGHGAFTKSLLEGIEDSKADYDNDGAITIKEIDLYVTNRVKVLTKGKQKPTTIIPSSVPDFAIGVK